MRTGWIALLILLVATPLAYGAATCFAAMSQGYGWSEMDWNNDGATSIAEFLEAGDIGVRALQRDDQLCMEFFSYKDGRPIRVNCNAG